MSKPTPNEVLIDVHSEPDRFGRQEFTAYWADGYLPPDGMRGQVFHAPLEDIEKRFSGKLVIFNA